MEDFLNSIPNQFYETKYGIKPHGFCLACMIQCHDGHEVYELYSKMDFRCDCGNSKMPLDCSLKNDKEEENKLNKYSRNFFDLYCHCN